jgi:hypothetical protein
MSIKNKVVLAIALVVGSSSFALAQGFDPNLGNRIRISLRPQRTGVDATLCARVRTGGALSASVPGEAALPHRAGGIRRAPDRSGRDGNVGHVSRTAG